MVQREVICDRCGDDISASDVRNESAKLQLWGPGEYRGTQGQRIDLCAKCYVDLVSFLESRDVTGSE